MYVINEKPDKFKEKLIMCKEWKISERGMKYEPEGRRDAE
jgi:hypothetical protein